MSDFIIYGGGFARPFTRDSDEVAAAQIGGWSPSTLDFQVSAAAAKGEAARDVDELMKKIAARSPGDIDDLGLIGHSNSAVFALAGAITVTPANVKFSQNAIIDVTELQNRQNEISKLRDRFSSKGRIILYGCHAGIGDSLLEAMSKAFGVCVAGFTNEVQYCFTWNLKTKAITARGKVYYDNSVLSSVGRIDCSNFYKDIRSLTPDKSSCAGAPPKAKGSGSGS